MMNRMLLCLTGLAAFSLLAGAQEAPPVAVAAETQAVQVPEKSPAEKLYIKAVAERKSGDPKQAVQTAAQIVALHADDADWLAKSEMLCAELYWELGLVDAADVTARQIQQLYAGTDVAKQAGALRSKIEKLKESEE